MYKSNQCISCPSFFEASLGFWHFCHYFNSDKKVKKNAQKIITVQDTTFAVSKGKPEKIRACWDSNLTSQYWCSTPTNNIELASQLEVI